MENRVLGKDVVALIQHVELNESGWIDSAVVKAVKFLFWMISDPTTIDQVFHQRSNVGLDALSRENIREAIAKLIEQDVVAELPGGFLKLSEAETVLVDKAVADAGAIETDVKKRVLDSAGIHGDLAEKDQGAALWEQFHREFIAPFIREFGARAYELITGIANDAQRTQFISEFLTKFPAEQREILEPMILALLDKNNTSCRTYVLRQLNSYFFHSALTLPDNVLQKTFSKGDRHRSLKLVLDTNFLFSLFELHANPSNEAVTLLLKTISKLPDNLKIKMYVLPSTIEEFRRTLISYESQAKSIIATKSIVTAAMRVDVAGVIQTYLSNVQKSGYKLTADAYFEPYHKNIKAILDQHNVSILNGEDDKYSTDQDTINDITDQLAFYKRRFINDPRRQKTYEQVRHDMVLWHFVSDRRPRVCDTVFEAEWIGVTIDFGLMAFDGHKRRMTGIPCMVHPASLVQVLQMLIPADENLERTILALMQMPFMFEPFNIDDEKVTRRILGTLSHFEGADTLTPDTIIDILGNKALRSKIERTANKEEEIELIRDAIVSHAAELEQKVKETEADLIKMREAQEKQQIAAEETIKSEQQERIRIEQERQRAQEIAQIGAEENARLKSKVEALEAAEKLRVATQQKRTQLFLLVGISLCSLSVLCALMLATYFYWSNLTSIGGRLAPWAVIATALAISLKAYRRLIRPITLFSNSRWCAIVAKVAHHTWALYLFVAYSLIQPLIYDLSKDDIPLVGQTERPEPVLKP